MSLTLSFVKTLIGSALLAAGTAGSFASSRHTIPLNSDWQFRFSHEVNNSDSRRVDLPHTWNASDALVGKIDYKRGIGNYTKTIPVGEELRGKRLYV